MERIPTIDDIEKKIAMAIFRNDLLKSLQLWNIIKRYNLNISKYNILNEVALIKFEHHCERDD